MKKILALSFLLVLVSCNEAQKNSVEKRRVTLKENNFSAITALTDFYSSPDTFSMFFLPSKASLTWSSSLFGADESYETKLSRVMKNIVVLSDKIDVVDKEIFPLNVEIAKNEAKQEEEGCLFDDTTDACQALLTELAPLAAKRDELIGLKSVHLEGIQQTLDEDITAPVNWQLYGTAKDYEFAINEATGVVESILMPTLGFPAQKYSSKDGDIYDMRYKPSIYNADVMILYFTLKEKGADGAYTGVLYEFKLEKSNFLDKIRFKGDVYKKLDGVEIQRGTCKFELPPKA